MYVSLTGQGNIHSVVVSDLNKWDHLMLQLFTFLRKISQVALINEERIRLNWEVQMTTTHILSIDLHRHAY